MAWRGFSHHLFSFLKARRGEAGQGKAGQGRAGQGEARLGEGFLKRRGKENLCRLKRFPAPSRGFPRS